jgi:hypothetical protein
MWGHASRRSLLAASCDVNFTSPNHSLCHCSEQSAAASRRYTGMTPIGFPFYVSTAVPGVYPGSRQSPIGHWYSHPVGGRCPLGAPVGRGGCTWQRAPLSHSIFTQELLEKGWDNSSWCAIQTARTGEGGGIRGSVMGRARGWWGNCHTRHARTRARSLPTPPTRLSHIK